MKDIPACNTEAERLVAENNMATSDGSLSVGKLLMSLVVGPHPN